MYHVYKDGYSVLPKLKKLGNDKIFEVTQDYDFFISEKEKAIEEQICFAERDMDQAIYDDVCKFIVDEYPIKLEEPYTFDNIGMQIQDDIVIHRIKDDKDWLAAAFVCFPSVWRVEEKMGKSFKEIHKPVPKMKLDKSFEMVKMCINKGPFVRFVWSPVFDETRINYHPRIPKESFSRDKPCMHCKVERQVIVGFPKHNALLFTIRQFLIPQEQLDLQAMLKSLTDMCWELEKYNGISKDTYGIKEFLKKEIKDKQEDPKDQAKPKSLVQFPLVQLPAPKPHNSLSQIPFASPPIANLQYLQNGQVMVNGEIMDKDEAEMRVFGRDWSGLN